MNCVLNSVKKKERNGLTLFFLCFHNKIHKCFTLADFHFPILIKDWGVGVNSVSEIYLQNTLMEK